MLLVSSVYRDDRVEIEDSCPHCLDRLTLTIEKAKLELADPELTYAFYGGG